VAAALQVHPRTARRLLNRLRDEGYLSRSEDARRLYAPTLRIVALAGQIVERTRLAERAVPVVAALHDETGAVAHLAIPSYRSVLCVVHGNGTGPAAPGLHELAPAHCTATGKALLGHRDAWRDSVLRLPLERRTARTITDPGALRAEAAAIRVRGYAVEDEEFRLGVRGVAAPVFSAAGEAAAALGVSGVDVEGLAERVLAAARALEAADG
jgi:DNA-binding IclR family transcriptional regulator